MDFFAQVDHNAFNAASGSSELYVKLLIGFILGVALIAAFMFAPTRSRRFIIGAFTFVSGLIYVAVYFWPKPIPPRAEGDVARSFTENVSFFLDDMVNLVGDFSNVLTGFLLGLGIYSLVRIHSARLLKKQKDWFFSLTLLVSLFGIAIIGLVDWSMTIGPNGPKLAEMANWGPWQWSRDILFDGLLQEMDAAFFSIIAFYILSAAYRAFRIRSIEATILLATALIVMVSLMGAIEFKWGQGIDSITHNDPGSFWNNLKISEIAGWLRDTVQTPALRAIQFGIGIGALAMGLRLWLSLERGGVRS